MKVILQQDVKGQGKKGQLIEASEGYARNYLLPRKLAIAATADAINTMNLKEKARRAEEARQKEAAMAAAERLKALLVKIPAKAGAGGRLFGAVTTKEISDALKAQHNVDIPKQGGTGIPFIIPTGQKVAGSLDAAIVSAGTT